MPNIYFLRHCTTELNLQGKISGRLESDLIAEAEIKKVEQVQDKKLVVFSSDLSRCRKTVKLLVSALVYEPEIHYCELLRERNMGVFEGKKRIELQKNYPEYFVNQRFFYQMTPPEGESFDEISQRVDRFIKEKLDGRNDREILICAHNQILKLLWCKLRNQSIEQIWEHLDFIGGMVIKLPQR